MYENWTRRVHRPVLLRLLGLLFVTSTSLMLACSQKPDIEETSEDEERAHLVHAETVDELPPRKRYVYEGGKQTKRKWVKRMIAERRFQTELCGKTDYLLNCMTDFKNPEKGVTGPFTQEDCEKAVTDIVGRELNIGGKGQGLRGAFYSESIPDTLEPGWQMDTVADSMGSRIIQILTSKMIKFGGERKKTPYCRALYLTAQASAVNGN